MTRISNTLLPTNSTGVPQMELTNASVAITTSGTLNVSDSVAQSSLSSIATNTSSLSGTLNVSDSTAQSSLSSIVSNTSSLSGTLNVSDSTAQSSLSSIASSVGGTLQVSSSATINGSAGNLYISASVSAGTASNTITIGSFTKNTIYVNSTTTDEIRVFLRGDSGTFVYSQSIYPFDPASGSNNEAVLSINDVVANSIKLEATATGTITASIFSRA